MKYFVLGILVQDSYRIILFCFVVCCCCDSCFFVLMRIDSVRSSLCDVSGSIRFIHSLSAFPFAGPCFGGEPQDFPSYYYCLRKV